MRSDRQRVRDILDAIERIERYAGVGREVFDADELVQVWHVRHLENIGEACRAMSRGFKRDHPAIPWDDIAAMRNVLAHQYFGIDLNAVWTAVQDHVPVLKQQVLALVESLPPAPQGLSPAPESDDP